MQYFGQYIGFKARFQIQIPTEEYLMDQAQELFQFVRFLPELICGTQL